MTAPYTLADLKTAYQRKEKLKDALNVPAKGKPAAKKGK